MRKIMLVALAVVALMCAPAMAGLTKEYNTTFNFEQSVQGSGYFMTYKYAKMGANVMKDYIHGSGSIDNENVLFAQEYWKQVNPWPGTGFEGIDADEYEEVGCISFNEDNVMVYSPMRMAIGTGYYAQNPLIYDSLLKEKTWVKNYRGGSSMHHEVEYAHAIDKELDILAKEKYYEYWDPILQGVGYTNMKIIEDVTDGKVHLGVLQGDVGPYTITLPWSAYAYPDSMATQTAWKNPNVEIDEDYFGTYHIEKNMTLEVPYKWTKTYPDWLPCCSGGWEGYGLADYWYKAQKGIFDCTCLKSARSTMYGLPVGTEPFKAWE